MYEFSRPQVDHLRVSVPPKRLLAERLLRSVEARKSVSKAPSLRERPVEVRCVFASKNDLPRVCASGWEGPKTMLRRMVQLMKRTAQATSLQRLAGRFARRVQSSASEPTLRPIQLRPVALKSRGH